MRSYVDLVQHVLLHGQPRADRTGTGTLSVFGAHWQHDLSASFPLLTLKRMSFSSVLAELLWFIEGSTSAHRLRELGSTIWDEWADWRGELGPIYGAQWRNWRTHDGQHVDQLAALLRSLADNPMSRRHIISAWNVADLPDETVGPHGNVATGRMCLAPCHMTAQFYVAPLTLSARANLLCSQDREATYILRRDAAQDVQHAVLDAAGVPVLGLSCHVYQRSADVFLGVPYNMASYAALTHMLAAQLGYGPDMLYFSYGDLHLYSDHNQPHIVGELLRRAGEPMLPPPQLRVQGKHAGIEGYTMADFQLLDYVSHPTIRARVSV